MSNIIIIFGISDRSNVKLSLFWFCIGTGSLSVRQTQVYVWLFIRRLMAAPSVICMLGIKQHVRPCYSMFQSKTPRRGIVRQGGPGEGCRGIYEMAQV